MNKAMVATLAAVTLACTSCGNSVALYPVSGKVIYKGAPAAGATVFLQRRGADPLTQQTVMGIVQEDGSFTLVCGPYGAGAPAGDYDVLIEWKPRSRQGRGLSQPVLDRFKGRYADPKHPLLHAVVRAGTNVLPDFDLSDS